MCRNNHKAVEKNQVTKIETRLGDPCRGRKSRKQEVHLISRRWAEGETGRTRTDAGCETFFFLFIAAPLPRGSITRVHTY